MGRIEDAHKQLREGLSANQGRCVASPPSQAFFAATYTALGTSRSLLLAYTLADLEEGKPDLASAYAIYDSLIEHLNTRIAQLEADVEAEISEAVTEREEVHAQQLKERVAGGGEEDTVEEREQKAEQIELLRKEIRERRKPEIESVKKAVANVWITEMRFARRSDVRLSVARVSRARVGADSRLLELQGLKQARNIFLRAKKSPNMAWQVVEASGAAHILLFRSSPSVELTPRLSSTQPRWRCTGTASPRSPPTCSSLA